MAWGSPGLVAATPHLTGITAVATSGSHGLALRSDGTVAAWGGTGSGEAVVPRGLHEVTALAAGPGFSLALRRDGTVVGWGRAGPRGAVHPPAGLDRVVAISAGDNHALALRSDGTVAAWGYDRDGQIAVPAGLGKVVAVAAGGFFSAALRADGTVVLWGYSVQLGDLLLYPAPSQPESLVNPVREVHGTWYGTVSLASATGAFGRYRAINAEWDHLLLVGPDGRVEATGSQYNAGIRVPPDLRGVTAVAAGAFHGLALRDDGTVVAWGERTAPGAPYVPAGLRHVVAIDAGGSYNVAVTTD